MARHEFELSLAARETFTVAFSMYEDDGETEFAAASTDQVRFKVWKTHGETPDLDLCETPTANGSRIQITTDGEGGVTAAVATLTIAQGDTASMLGKYNAELGFIDDSVTTPNDPYSVVARGHVTFVGSAGGDRGKA